MERRDWKSSARGFGPRRAGRNEGARGTWSDKGDKGVVKKVARGDEGW